MNFISNKKILLKKLTLFVLLFTSIYITDTGFAQQVNDWENPAVNQINTEAPHATFIPFNSEVEAFENDLNKSGCYQLLNGNWKFHWSKNPASRPVGFYHTDYDVSKWNELPVPSDWQMHGYDYPIYINIGYPFPKNQPYMPEDFNPIGSYKHFFEIPESWDRHDVFIHFAGVNSAFYLWINGEKVGYHEDSKTATEFNITPFLKKGKNELAVEVYRWCDGSYLEDQDFWRLSGIERDVYLLATPKVRINDFFVIAGLDKKYQEGQFKLDVEISKKTEQSLSGYSLVVKVQDGSQTIFRQKKALNITKGKNQANLSNIRQKQKHMI